MVLEVEHEGVVTVLSGLLDGFLLGLHDVLLDRNALGLLGITLGLDSHSSGSLNVVLLGLLDGLLGRILPVSMRIVTGRKILFPSQDRVALDARWACKWR